MAIDMTLNKEKAIKKLNELIIKIQNDDYIVDNMTLDYNRRDCIVVDRQYSHITLTVSMLCADKD